MRTIQDTMTEPMGILLPHDHAVSFYDHDVDVVGEVARFAADGLLAGERVIVVATAEHRAAVEALLLPYDVDGARASGGYLGLDAADMLAAFMVDGTPDEDRFQRSIGAIVDAATADGTPVRVFGEMVALLWDDGNVAAAVHLEGVWNELAAGYQFALLCAYPMRALQGATLTDATHVCYLHTRVNPPHSYEAVARQDAEVAPDVVRTSEVYLPVPAAVPATRRFVSEALCSWGLAGLIDDAQLITSELATNSVNHGMSAFRVRVQHTAGIVRISIQDIGLNRPELLSVEPESDGGRGVAIVEMTASSWGFDFVDEGKEVWAELTQSAV